MMDPQEPQAESAPNPRNVKEEVRSWLSRITSAEKYRTQVAEKYRWKDFLNEFKGRFSITNGSVDIQINPLNFIFAYVKTEIPALYLRDPHIKVNPKREASVESAKILELALNYLWRHKKIKRENKKNIQDGKLIGHSWFKTGYTGQTGTVEDGNGNTIETIESEDFFGYRVPWDCIAYNKGAIDPPHDCNWVSHTVWAPLEDVKSNPRYKNTERLTAQKKDNNYFNTTDDTTTPNDFDEAMVCLKEVWDIKKRQVFTVSDGIDDYLEAPKPWPYEMKGFPFSYLNFNPVNDEPYGLPDVYMFEPQVLELMKIRAMMLDHLKRFNRQLITTPNNFSPEQKDALMLGVTATVVEAKEPQNVFPIPYPALQTDIYGIEERLKEDMINISGQSPQERGASQKTSTRTFGELQQIAKGAENRRGEQIDLVEGFVEEIAAKFVALLQQFADMPYYVRVTGKMPDEIMKALSERPSAQMQGAVTSANGFTFTKEDIQGEFDIEVVAGSTAPLDRQNKMAVLMQILEILPQLGAIPGGPVVGAIGRMLTDELEMPELITAMNQEIQMQAQMKQEAKQQQDQQMQLQAATETSKRTIDAEKVATKQSEVLLKAIDTMRPEPKPVNGAKP